MRLVYRVSIASAALGVALAAWAQVPPHAPGTICFTPKFWCWANQPGPPGALCYCRTGAGPVAGRFG